MARLCKAFDRSLGGRRAGCVVSLAALQRSHIREARNADLPVLQVQLVIGLARHESWAHLRSVANECAMDDRSRALALAGGREGGRQASLRAVAIFARGGQFRGAEHTGVVAKSINQPINQSTNQLTNQPTNQSTHRSIDRSTERTFVVAKKISWNAPLTCADCDLEGGTMRSGVFEGVGRGDTGSGAWARAYARGHGRGRAHECVPSPKDA